MLKLLKKYGLLFLSLLTLPVIAQTSDSIMIRKLYDEALQHGETDANLRYLTSRIGARINGSLQAQKTVIWAKQTLENYHPDNVYLQSVIVPHWVRGTKETS
jgi:hypothetical protein